MPTPTRIPPETVAVGLASINLTGVLMARLIAVGLLEREEALMLLNTAKAATAALLDTKDMSMAAPIALSFLAPIEGLLRSAPDPDQKLRRRRR